MITDEQLELAASGDPDSLATLDGRGFLIGAEEGAVAYAERVRSLRNRLAGMEETLARQGFYEVEGLKFPGDMRIPQELVADVSPVTREHYGFGIDWVPGFFADQSFGWLFGGCAYYFDPEFFAIFVIRRSFEKRNRWLMYNRDELLAHELCHVARSGLKSAFFEEEFAYGISQSGFRRTVGGLFRTGREAFYILGAALLLLAVQIVQLFFWPRLPIWPFWLLMAGIVAYLVAQLLQLRKQIKAARRNLGKIAGDRTEPILFRCTDAEILEIAATGDAGRLRAWLDGKRQNSLRWQVIHRRFLENGAGDGAP